MAEVTTSLQTLRREICHELQMPFARRFKAGYSEVDSGCTTTKIIDASLTQKNAFWNGSWHYQVATQETSKIRAFDRATQSYQLEIPLAGSPSAGDDYEVHSIWNAIDIHRAINRAIRTVQRVYVQTVTDETMVLQADKLDYDLSSLTTTPWTINRVWLENRDLRNGTVQSATNTTVVVENSGILSDVTNTWYVSIYDGTGKGQVRAVVSVLGATITVATWTTNPDSTSKYALWDASEQLRTWIPLEAWRMDSKEWPTKLYLMHRIPHLFGMRIRLEYIAYPSELSAEADTTTVPPEYILPKACSLLYGQKLKDNKVDRETYYAESERYKDQADAFLIRNLPQKPDTQLKSHQSTEFYLEDDPLGWGAAR